jgi:hypothetical protein
MFGAQVGPDDAVKNICRWARLVDEVVPDQCIPLSGRVFSVLLLSAFAISVVWLLFPFGKRLYRWWRPAVPKPTAGIPSKLRISTGEDGGYYSTHQMSLYRYRRRLNLKLENVDPERPITEIRVLLECIGAEPHYAGPWTLASGLSLAAGDHTFVQLVSFGEAEDNPGYPSSRYDRSDSDFEFMVGGSPGSRPAFPKGSSQYFLIKAIGMGTAPCEYRGKVWVDRSDGRLRIGDADDGAAENGEYVPAFEASREAYDEVFEEHGRHVRQLEHGDVNGIITWYCHLMRRQGVMFFGTRPPGKALREAQLQPGVFDFRVENGGVVATSRFDDNDRWNGLCVKRTQLQRFIEWLRRNGFPDA